MGIGVFAPGWECGRMEPSVTNPLKAATLVVIGLAVAAMGVYVASADDAPGAAAIGFVLMLGAVVLGARAARNRLPIWAGRAALAVGILAVAFAAFLTHAVTVAAPLFAQAGDVPSAAASTLPTPTVERARSMVRTALATQNLPGVSVAVGTNAGLVWAEGFGWRDVATETPVTPDTRFNIGTAASAIPASAIAPLGLTRTGADSATEWSPNHTGEPEEDFPLFTLVHDIILRPLGIGRPAQPLPDERATFYVPRSDDNDPRRGRRLMYMRDLACCADGMAFSSTPSDLVRFALATKTGSVNGDLAGGRVVSLVARSDSGIIVAVASNIAHADTHALALAVADVFAEPK